MPYKLRVGKLYLDNCGETILRRARLLMWFCAVLCITASAEATTYYVSTSGSDSNPGTIEQPFRTVNRAVGVLRAGDTLYVRGGTYVDRFVDTDFRAGGTASAPIVVSGYPGESVVILNNGTDAITGFMIAGREYIVIQDMTLDGSNVNMGYGVVLFNNNVTFRRVEITGAWKNGILGGGSGHQFIDLKVHGNGREPAAVYTPGHNGIYMASDNVLVQGGEYYDNQCYGLRFLDSAASHRSSNNVISGVRSYNNGLGKGLGGTSRCGSGGGGIVIGDTNNVIRNSIVYNNLYGVEVTGVSGKMVQGAKIYN
ncbi:MAG: right-handed parallel beta-helix repeat-containing protein, partial [Phycisphaerae bacterium]|nr:right-handed parallel beta-helix repeat-containing protein [Gemmatimonadaceae bacterium]